MHLFLKPGCLVSLFLIETRPARNIFGGPLSRCTALNRLRFVQIRCLLQRKVEVGVADFFRGRRVALVQVFGLPCWSDLGYNQQCYELPAMEIKVAAVCGHVEEFHLLFGFDTFHSSPSSQTILMIVRSAFDNLKLCI